MNAELGFQVEREQQQNKMLLTVQHTSVRSIRISTFTFGSGSQQWFASKEDSVCGYSL